VDLVGEGFDAALRIGYLQDSTLVARRIAPISGRAVASPAYLAEHGTPTTLDELLQHPAIMQGLETWRVRDGDRVITLHPRGRFKADNGQAIVVAVRAGLGVAMLPDFLIDEDVASGALTVLLPNYPVPDAGLYVVRPPGDHAPRKVRVLTEMLVAHFGAQARPTGA
jgi:DNA-binding transcriptional LysR family regulator